MTTTRDAGGDHEAFFVSKGVNINVDASGLLTGHWTEEEVDEEGFVVVADDDRWMRYQMRLAGQLSMGGRGWKLQLQAHYDGRRWEMYYDEFTLHMESAIDGLELIFFGSHECKGSPAGGWAKGDDARVRISEWRPPPTRSSARLHTG